MAKLIVGLLVVAGIGAAGVSGWSKWRSARAVKSAKESLDQGFAALAADSLEEQRRYIPKTKENCQLLMNVYFTARTPGLLEWAAQACLANKVEIPEVHLGLAAAREMNGRPQEALQVLGSVIEKYKDIPDIFYRMAQLLARLGNAESAAVAYEQAMTKAPTNTGLLLEALEYMSNQKLWERAKPLARRIKDAQTDNPAIKLLVARVLVNSGEAEAAKPVIESARAQLAQSPNRTQLEQVFADVLKGKQ